ncbi:MAG: sigma-70 family RNA polymerase sigma factor [Gammaproteobacteria bacterium]|nr:sigma-70 family RNA polymerase sigma factor [Gammaproteobacteria bacterium]
MQPAKVTMIKNLPKTPTSREKRGEINRDIISNLGEFEISSALNYAVNYARKKVGSRFDHGMSAEDFVNDAMQRFLEGQRTLTTEKHFVHQLTSTVQSLIYHHHKKFHGRDIIQGDGDSDSVSDPDIYSAPESSLEYKEQIESLLNFVSNSGNELDTLILKIYMVRGKVSNSELCKELNKPMSEILNAKKSLKRTVLNYKKDRDNKPFNINYIIRRKAIDI